MKLDRNVCIDNFSLVSYRKVGNAERYDSPKEATKRYLALQEPDRMGKNPIFVLDGLHEESVYYSTV